jgi:phenylacetate-CoA ligase
MTSPVDTWLARRTGLYDDLNPESLSRWQGEMLKEALKHARRSRFYCGKITGSENLNELPFTSPEDIVNDPYAFLAINQADVLRVTTLANSGTTYLKKRIFFSGSDLERTIEFFSAGMSALVEEGDHVQILISNRTENSLGSLLRESLHRIGVSSEITGVLKSADKAAELASAADCIVGMPAEILYMCRTAPNLRPKSVLLAADIAPEPLIDSIKEAWRCDVFTHYGHTEFGYGYAVDCQEHDGLHLRSADIIAEIIDPLTDQPAKPGEKGEIVITTLSNEAMPLIRYRTGNISALTEKPCSCGSKVPSLKKIEGRIHDQIDTGHGKLGICDLDRIVFVNPAVNAFDAFYNSAERSLTLLIDSYDHIDQSELKASLPEGLTLYVRYEKNDPFTHRGKRRIRLS